MKFARIGPWLGLGMLVVTGSSCGSGHKDPLPPGTYFVLTGDPDPSIVFSTSDVCFSYPNNLTNGAWHANSNLIVVGDYNDSGYWSHPANAGGYPTSPNNGAGGYRRLVHMPRTEIVAYTTSAGFDGIGSSPATDLVLAPMDRTTGALGAGSAAVFSDGYSGTCNVLSSSIDELFILENGTTIRRYGTTAGSNVLTLLGTITLSQAVTPEGQCLPGGPCYGGTFAWDGKFFYFARHQGDSGNLGYDVFLGNGAYVNTYTAAGGGGMNGVYFDWSVGRYALHDGYGDRSAATVYNSVGLGDSDTQCYGPVSVEHSFHP